MLANRFFLIVGKVALFFTKKKKTFDFVQFLVTSFPKACLSSPRTTGNSKKMNE